MVFKSKDVVNGWMLVRYNSTWKMPWDFILYAAQEIIDSDFSKKGLGRVAVGFGHERTECLDEVIQHNGILANCPTVKKENGFLIVSGISKIMENPIQIELYNQTNEVILQTNNLSVFSEHGDNVFTNYLNSMEILAYHKLAMANAGMEPPLAKGFNSKGNYLSFWKKLFS